MRHIESVALLLAVVCGIPFAAVGFAIGSRYVLDAACWIGNAVLDVMARLAEEDTAVGVFDTQQNLHPRPKR